ncbi:tyrosine-protein phosphatase non-receptor type 4 isoform X2 [Tetranychus urticae]|uniref:tyrosine-protein phosphatase non-receptor type 4 isoform X2 n=1 Tax=Tetranychus urticae TaxID=32264 RepID=UPI00077BDD21|nr:tyrosine-protein phosphatase non-receptor type 4 isoform X2 [Tetranychus urticae]
MFDFLHSHRTLAVYSSDIANEDGHDDEEPPFQYIPVDASPPSRSKTKCDRLLESIMLLREGLESGDMIFQFEQLYRKKPGEGMTIARLPDNLYKNRYRDISPYDATRVVLKKCSSGDYVNASFVNMEIPGSGIVNKYIATQGPLSSTCEEFWQMVWEQGCRLIVMVTPLIERGRSKCHKYWPNVEESEKYGDHLKIFSSYESGNASMVERHLKLTNLETSEERDIVQFQYLAWPDHGVPDDATEFLNLIGQVRKHRSSCTDPIIVHCSAGIGRTGVLILMETAMCLIEANEPIYPLEILKAMRDQRAMLIQTSNQFRFVLEAIDKVYKEEIVKPLVPIDTEKQ